MSKPEQFPLELDETEFARLVEAAMARLGPYLATIGDRRTAELDPELAKQALESLSESLPEDGQPLDAVLDQVMACATPGFHTAGPGYLAFIPGGGLVHTAVGDLMSGVINRFVGVHAAAPGLSALENRVTRWLCDLVGYGDGALGFLTSGGSMANFGALVTARRERLGDDFSRGVIYVSDQAHLSMVSAATLAGFPRRNIRLLPADAHFRLNPQVLREQITEDRARGLTPFLIGANAGSTNSGAIDPLKALADIAEAEELWLHADGAYGAAFLMTERGRERLSGIERADSVTLDPHKGFFLPYGTGALVVRDGAALGRTFHHDADYLTILSEDPATTDLCRISPELSRPFRGLRVWLPLKLAGARAFRDSLDEKLDLAAYAAAQVEQIPGISIVAPPELSLFAFRYAPPNMEPDSVDRTDAQIDDLNRAILDDVAAAGRVFLSGTMLNGRFACRLCVLSFRTHMEHVDVALDDIRTAISRL